MIPFLKNQIRVIRTALWFRPTIFCLIAVAASLAISVVDTFVPDQFLKFLPSIDFETVRGLLRLLAGSMLTVTTVVLSVLMLVISLATNQASPRAIPELMADQVTQNALGTFLSAFVFSLMALLLLGAGGGSDAAVTLNFFVSLFLVALSVKYLLQWIHHVAHSMKLNKIIEQIYKQATASLEAYLQKGDHECDNQTLGLEMNSAKVYPQSTGYVQLVDEELLCELTDDHGLSVSMVVQEGDFVHPHTPLMNASGEKIDGALTKELSAAIVVGFERSVEGDPRLSFELLAEVACRALSSGINDPQSSVVCIDYLGSLLAIAGTKPPEQYPKVFRGKSQVSFLRVDFEMMLVRSFRPIIRDGAAFWEVMHAVLNVLHNLTLQVDEAYLDIVAQEIDRLLKSAEASLPLSEDRKRLNDQVTQINFASSSR